LKDTTTSSEAEPGRLAQREGVGVGREAAEVGLLAADEGALALQVDVGEAEDVAVLGLRSPR
jgi:hypothetical protein